MSETKQKDNNIVTEISIPPPQNPIQWLIRVCQGIVIGSGAILPGISGGVLCVAFGLYQAMMTLLAHPMKAFKKAWKLFLPVCIGWVMGFWLFAKLLDWMFEKDATIATALFIGLILGSFPSLMHEANREGHSKASWVSMAVSTAVMLASFILLNKAGEGISLTPNAGWFFFCGILWGLSLIVPGLSSSSLEIFLGLYAPMTAGISDGNMMVILPMFAGILCTVAALAKLVDYLFRKYYSIAFYAVIGFVIASTVVIIPLRYASLSHALLALLAAVIGFAAAYGSEKIGK